MRGPGERPERILAIAPRGMRAFVQALGAVKAIRAHHLGGRLTLLAAAAFAELAGGADWFDDVWLDPCPRPLDIGGWWRLRRRLRSGAFDRVYDLETSPRSDFYFRLLAGGERPEWSGTARGCSHPHDNPDRGELHGLDRLAEQLALAGIAFTPPPDVSWVRADASRFETGGRFALLVPGGAAGRRDRRWPAESYARLAWRLSAAGIRPLLIGGGAERQLGADIAAACEGAADLTGRTELAEVVELARRAEVAVGNDSGPLHLAAAAACPTVVLVRAGIAAPGPPRGRAVTVLRRRTLSELGVDEVAAAVLG